MPNDELSGRKGLTKNHATPEHPGPRENGSSYK